MKTIGDSVGADQKTVTGRASDSANLRGHELVAGSQGFLKEVAARVVLGLPLIDLPFAVEPADMGVVLCELLDSSFRGKVVDAAVPDMPEVHPPRGEPAETEGGPHPLALLIA